MELSGSEPGKSHSSELGVKMAPNRSGCLATPLKPSHVEHHANARRWERGGIEIGPVGNNWQYG